jgi:molybdopterin converting factor small subunit
MHITVHLYSYLRYYMPSAEKLFRDKEWDLPEGTAVREVVSSLELPKGVPITVLLNNNSVDQAAVLKEGDVIHILPLMGGG